MPLKCLQDGDPVFAFDFTLDAWESLKAENRKRKHLSMPCCEAKATPKTSKLGTQFFAHARTDACAAPAETAEHLLAKATCAEAAKLAGWEVDTEVFGVSPDGETWIADVLASKGNARVPIEVQWSRQKVDETKRRQEKYKQSGLRGLWLMRNSDLVVEKETPTFRLRYDEGLRKFVVLVAASQEVDLAQFVAGTLRGALKFAPAIGRKMPLSVSTAIVECWRCKKETQIVLGLEFHAGKVLPGHASISAQLYDFDNQDCGGAFFAAAFPHELLRQHGIGAIKNRYSRTAGCSYLSNGCFHCDAIQGRFFDHDSWFDAEPAYTVEVELTQRLVHQIQESESGYESEIFCWWFDQSVADR